MIAILVLAILTVIGIALMLITSTESRIAANEWSVNRAFYASDAGIRWATVQMHDPVPFMARPEFAGTKRGALRIPRRPPVRRLRNIPARTTSPTRGKATQANSAFNLRRT